MNSIISIVFAACAVLASVECSSYGYGSSASVLNAQSYSLGASHGDYGPAPVYASSVAPPYYSSKSRFIIQPLVTHEIYPGRNQYKSYRSPPYYSQITLPIVPSAPLARLYGGSSGGYGGSSY